MPKVPAARRSQEPSATAACLPGLCLGSVPDIPTPRPSGEGHRDSRASGESTGKARLRQAGGTEAQFVWDELGGGARAWAMPEREGEKGTQRGHLRRRR